ncbi:MAG: helix-turn-helix transcriptional regulator [Ruminococcaceae bacterium]|nr:helix-turn-helix transcriptional regulator [Oscillospiraceae bacterium]
MKQARGKKNICGERIRYVRLGKYSKNHLRITQNELAARLQSRGLMLDRLTVNRIELGIRMVSDIELVVFADALRVPVEFLLGDIQLPLPEINFYTSRVAE